MTLLSLQQMFCVLLACKPTHLSANLMFIGPYIIAIVDEWKTNLMSLAIFYFTYYALNMFRTLIYPLSGACDCVDELPHRSSCSQFAVCWSFCCGWYLVVFVLQVEALQVLQPAKRTPPNISRSKNCNTQRTENKTTDVVIHQHSRRLRKMYILMSETCWAHNKWNKIASDIKLVFHSSTLALFASTIRPAFIGASHVVYCSTILFFFIAKGFITPLHDIKYQEVRWLYQKFHKGSKVMQSSVPVNGEWGWSLVNLVCVECLSVQSRFSCWRMKRSGLLVYFKYCLIQ